MFGEFGKYAGVVPALLLTPSSQWLFPSTESKAEREVLDNFKRKIHVTVASEQNKAW